MCRIRSVYPVHPPPPPPPSASPAVADDAPSSPRTMCKSTRLLSNARAERTERRMDYFHRRHRGREADNEGTTTTTGRREEAVGRGRRGCVSFSYGGHAAGSVPSVNAQGNAPTPRVSTGCPDYVAVRLHADRSEGGDSEPPSARCLVAPRSSEFLPPRYFNCRYCCLSTSCAKTNEGDMMIKYNCLYMYLKKKQKDRNWRCSLILIHTAGTLRLIYYS